MFSEQEQTFLSEVIQAVVKNLALVIFLANDSNGKDRELRKKLHADRYMLSAVCECYASFRNIVKYLVEGDVEKK